MNILTDGQRKVISLLAKSPLREKFYWTGGTLLACHYLKHRRSLDMDFFSEEEFSFDEVNPLVQRIRSDLRFRRVRYQKIFDRFEFLFENKEPLRLEFVHYDHQKKTLRKRKKLWGVAIDSLEDLAANKAMAFLDRNEPKDLFDLYFLLTKKGLAPKKLLELVSQKFGVKLEESSLWSEAFKGLPWLVELKPLMLEKTEAEKANLLEKIKDYFEDRSHQFLRRSFE